MPGQYRTREKLHSFSNSLVFTISGGANISQTDYFNMQPGMGFGGAFEYYFPATTSFSYGLGVFARKEMLFGEDKNKKPKSFSTDLFQFGAGASFSYSAGDLFFPYVSAGVSAASINGTSASNPPGKSNQSIIVPGFDVEAGFKVPVTRSLILSLNTGYHYLISDKMDNYQIGKYNDFYLSGTVGISYSFSLGHKYERVMPESPPIRNRQETDSASVVRNDKNIQVSPISAGISVHDSSSLSGINKKPGSEEIMVKQDTVRTYTVLTEPSTVNRTETGSSGKVNRRIPENAPVIPPAAGKKNTDAPVKENRRSTEAGTASEKTAPDKTSGNKSAAEKPASGKNTKLAKAEKPKETAREKVNPPAARTRNSKASEILLYGEVTFVRDEAVIQPDAYGRLNEVANTIKQEPEAKWVIEAYTDDHGDPSELKSFTAKRAKAVLQYLKSQGIPASQLQAEGMGSKDPVEDNNNVWGRMMNRRIVIKRIN